jgi:Ulp1 family protease
LQEKGYTAVERHTKNLDIFSKKVLFFPLHDNDLQHWQLGALLNPGSLLENSPEPTGIFIFDSIHNNLNKFHSQAIHSLKKYLYAEAFHRMQKKINISLISEKLLKTPKQKNNYDCGMYLMFYVEFFLKDPIKYSKLLMVSCFV